MKSIYYSLQNSCQSSYTAQSFQFNCRLREAFAGSLHQTVSFLCMDKLLQILGRLRAKWLVHQFPVLKVSGSNPAEGTQSLGCRNVTGLSWNKSFYDQETTKLSCRTVKDHSFVGLDLDCIVYDFILQKRILVCPEARERRWPGVMLTKPSSSTPKGQGQYGHLTLYPLGNSIVHQGFFTFVYKKERYDYKAGI